MPAMIIHRFLPYSGDLTIGCPAARVCHDEFDQTDRVNHGRLDLLGPSAGERDSGQISVSSHTASKEHRGLA